MSDLISRQAALDIINHELNGWLTDDERLHLEGIGIGIESLPSADVPDRKVGEWIWMGDKGDSRFMCSVCKGKENVPTIMGNPIVWDYCPNCGARMKGEEDAEVH